MRKVHNEWLPREFMVGGNERFKVIENGLWTFGGELFSSRHLCMLQHEEINRF